MSSAKRQVRRKKASPIPRGLRPTAALPLPSEGRVAKSKTPRKSKRAAKAPHPGPLPRGKGEKTSGAKRFNPSPLQPFSRPKGARKLRSRPKAARPKATEDAAIRLTAQSHPALLHRRTLALEDALEQLRIQNEALVEAQFDLAESVHRFADLYDYAPIGIVTLSKAGRIEQINLTGAALLGYERSRLKGHSFSVFVAGKESLMRFQEHLDRCGKSAETVVTELRLTCREHRLKPVQLVTTPSTTDRPRHLLTAIVDLTELKATQSALSGSEQRLAGIVRSAMDAIITVDESQRIVMFNHAAENMFGCSAHEALGCPIGRFIPDRFRAAHEKHIRRFDQTGETNRAMGKLGAISGLRCNGEEFPIEASISQIEVEGRKLFTVILRDISERVRTERALQEHQTRLALAHQAARIGTFEWNVRTGVNTWSPELEMMHGLAPGTFPGTQDAWEQQVHPDDRAAAKKWVRQAFDTGEPVAADWRVVWPDGTVRWIAARFQVLSGADGKPQALTGVNIDITARKQSEEALRESETRLRLFIDHAPAAIAMFDREMRYLAVSERWKRNYGLEGQEITGQSHYEIFPHMPKRWKDAHRRALRGEVLRADEDPVRHVDGKMRWVQWEARPWRDANGEIGGILIASEDVTARVLDKRALMESEERKTAIFENALDALITIDREGTIIEWNPAAARIFGYRPAEALGREMAELIIPPRLRAAHRQGIAHFLATGEAPIFRKLLEMPAIRADGSEFFAEIFITPIGSDPALFTGFVRDITERKQAEAELRESEARFRAMADSAPVLIWISGPDKLCTWFNKPWLEFVGRPMEKELGNGWAENVHPDDFQRCLTTYTEAFDARESFGMEYRLRRHDGEYRWILDHGVPRYLPGGEFNGYIGSCLDITERHRTELALRESAARVRLATSVSGMGVFEWNVLTDRATWENRRMYDIFGVDFGEETINFEDFMERVVHPEDAAIMKRAIIEGMTHAQPLHTTCRIRRESDGAWRWIEVSGTFDLSPEGKPVRMVGVMRDITERKEAELALQQSRDDFNRAQSVAHVGSWRLDVRRNELTWSDESYRIARIPIGTPLTYESFLAIVHPEDRDYVDRKWKAALQGEAYDIEHRLVVNGELRWAREQAQLEFDAQGQLLGAFGTFHDITERKQAEEMQARLAAIVDASGDVILSTDLNSIVRSWNPAAEALFGYRADEIVGQSILRLFPPELQGEEAVLISRLLDGETITGMETIRCTKSGQRVPVALTLSPIFDQTGKVIGTSRVMRDITERKETDEALRRAKDELETRVEERTMELVVANEKLRATMTERLQLENALLNVAEQERRRVGQDLHDGLGQSLSGLVFMTRAVARTLEKNGRETEARDVNRLSDMVHQTVVEARNLAKGLHPVDIDANGLVAALRELAQRTTGKVRCTFRCVSEVPVSDNNVAMHLYRIAQEAVANAIKHGQPRHVTISLNRHDHELTLRVTDDGKGLPESFYQSPGMGVHLMRYRADVIGARLVISRASQGGTRVTCTMAMPPSPPPTERPRPRKERLK